MLRFLVLGAAGLLGVGCATGPLAPAADLLISNVRIVDGTGGEPRIASVLVDNGRIAAIIPSGEPLPSAEEVIDATGGTIIPGLWDMHVHLAEDLLRPELLDDFVRHGVTSVRDAGGHIDVLRQWDREARAGERTGPMIHAAGPTLNGPGDDSYHLEVRTTADAATAVRTVLASGARQIKVHHRLSADALKAVIDAAEQHGAPVFGHIASGVSPLEACRWGMKGFEHLSALMGAYVDSREGAGLLEAVQYLRGPESEPFYECVRESGGYIDPTLITLRYLGQSSGGDTAKLAERQIAALQPVILRLHEERVSMVAGSDVGLGATDMPAGRSLIEELRLLKESGLPWPEVIRVGTLNAATAMGVATDRGSIEVDKMADLVLFRGDPFLDPKLLLEPARVWVEGRLVHVK